jgi:hypothetical protein
MLQAIAELCELQWAPEPGTAGSDYREGTAAGSSTDSPPQGAGSTAREVSYSFLFLSACSRNVTASR